MKVKKNSLMKKMRILYTIPNFETAGSGRVVLDLIKGLKNDFEIHVACFHLNGELAKEVRAEGVVIHEFLFTEKIKPYYTLIPRIIRIKKFFSENKFDIIHSWHYLDDWSEPLAARLAGVPFIFTKKSMSWGGKEWWIRSKLANKIITINSEMNIKFFPNWKNVEYMPLGLDIDFYIPLKRDREALKNLPINEDDFVLMSIANLVPVKGIETSLRAMNVAQKQNIKYVLVGSCEEAYKLKLDVLIKELCLENQVFFVGKQNDVRSFLAAADLFVIPTNNEGRKEGQPMAPLEAMASQRLVTGSKIPGVVDILKGFDDYLFDAGDFIALAQIIKNIQVMSECDIESLATKMREKVVQNYNLKEFISSHKLMYQKLIR
jgi:glycosyltransferase involved in cell wall biosynthesis